MHKQKDTHALNTPRRLRIACPLLPFYLVLGAPPAVVVMAGCVLVACVQHLSEGKEALQARDGSQREVCASLLNVVRCALRTRCC